MIEDVTAAKCVDLAVRLEELGAELYRRLAIRFATDGELSALFQGLRRDEVHHQEQFRGLRDRAASRPAGRALSDEQKQYLRAMSMADAFPGGEGLEADLDAIKTREDALERVLGAEKATLAFYQAMRDVLGGDEVLESLISVEKTHVVKVMELMITGAKYRGLADRF